MFGYLQPDKPELKVKDFALYRAAYCGVCRAIKLAYGELPRFSVSYDAALLALILISAQGSPVRTQMRACALNPVRRKPVLDGNEVFGYVAAVSVLLAWGRLKDAWADEKHPLALPAMAGLALARRKAERLYPALAGHIKQRLGELSALEREGCSELDRPSDVMGHLMSGVLLDGPQQSPSAKVLLRSMGYHMGRWVYLVDALDDMEKDEKEGCYNPILALCGPRAEGVKLAQDSCVYSASQAAAVFDLMDLQWAGDVLANLFYSGMPKMLEKVCTKEKKTNE